MDQYSGFIEHLKQIRFNQIIDIPKDHPESFTNDNIKVIEYKGDYDLILNELKKNYNKD